MEIGRLEAADITLAVTLLEAQFAEHRIAMGGSDLEQALHGLVSVPSRGAVLVTRDPEPVAIAVLAFTWTLEHGGLVAWLEELYVRPAERGQGRGRALLRAALETARLAGCRAVDLEVDEDHARAENLYAREGFHRLERRRWARSLRADGTTA